METTEKKVNIHKEPLFSFKTAVSVKEVEGLNNHVYETLRSKIEDLKRKGYDTWELEAEVLKLDSARREISSSIMRIANLINGVESKKEEVVEKNGVVFLEPSYFETAEGVDYIIRFGFPTHTQNGRNSVNITEELNSTINHFIASSEGQVKYKTESKRDEAMLYTKKILESYDYTVVTRK